METTEYSRLAGHKFPTGEYTLEPHVAWLWADSLMSTPDAATVHPTMGHYVALRGGGASIGQIIELMGGDPATGGGSMLGRVKVSFSGALKVGTTYKIDGEIVKVDRKRGRRAGVFDRVEFLAQVREKDTGELILESTNTWVFLRKEEQ